MKDYADGVLELMDKLNIEKATLVGHSFGGRVAIYIAAKYPEKVEKLVLVDSAGIKPRRGIKYRLKILLHKILKKFGKGLKGSKDYRALSPVMKKTFQNVVNYDETYLLSDITADTAISGAIRTKTLPFIWRENSTKKLNRVICFYSQTRGIFHI